MMKSSDFISDERPMRENEQGNKIEMLCFTKVYWENCRTIMMTRLKIITSCSDTGRKMISNHFANLYLIFFTKIKKMQSFIYLLFLQ